MKKLGVIGGMGPLATAHFYELIIQMTDATKDQDHIDMVIYSKASIPDRTDYILGNSQENPVTTMIEAGKSLVLSGVDYIAIPCVTGHNFYDQIAANLEVPVIHMIKETVRYLKLHGVQCAGIMATDGTIISKIFQNELERSGIKAVIPSQRMQTYISSLIYQNIKANLPPDMDKFYAVSEELKSNSAEIIILGCTELSLIKRDNSIGSGFLDALEVLAMHSIQLCDAKIKKEYSSLIT